MNFSTLTQRAILEGQRRHKEAKQAYNESKDYWNQQATLIKAGALLATGVLADKASRTYIGMPLVILLRNIIIARATTEVVGTGVSYLIDEEEGVDNWREASTIMFDWWGAEDLGWGPYNPLQYIPNPVGIGEVLFKSGILIGEATKGWWNKGTSKETLEYRELQAERLTALYLNEPNQNVQGVPGYLVNHMTYEQQLAWIANQS